MHITDTDGPCVGIITVVLPVYELMTAWFPTSPRLPQCLQISRVTAAAGLGPDSGTCSHGVRGPARSPGVCGRTVIVMSPDSV
eukprot:176343-Hanusia_phi.AAC.1